MVSPLFFPIFLIFSAFEGADTGAKDLESVVPEVVVESAFVVQVDEA